MNYYPQHQQQQQNTTTKKKGEEKEWFARDEVVIGLNISTYCLLFVSTAIIGHLHIAHIHAWKEVISGLLCVAWGILIITWSIRLNMILNIENDKNFS